jgi:ubiquinone/menaquinone biosynthesis C-methylase UbiE
MLAQQHADKILRHYNNPAVAAGYGRQQYITPCEHLLFSTYIKPGIAILDIGVGGGRTSQFLGKDASRYVGVDYAPEMVRLCRERYPQWEYYEASATDLSRFQNGTFDAVIMSYNMIDDLVPDENRYRCLRECYRVLRENGLLIFSSHNPRAIFARPGEDATGAQWLAPTVRSGRISALFRNALKCGATIVIPIWSSAQRIRRYGFKAPLWKGQGYMLDSEKLMTHFCIPKRVIAEVTLHGFRVIALKGDDYPRKSHLLMTEWYYYVCQK